MGGLWHCFNHMNPESNLIRFWMRTSLRIANMIPSSESSHAKHLFLLLCNCDIR